MPFVPCPHLGAGTRSQSSCAPTRVLNFDAAGEDPKTLGHFLIADLPAEQCLSAIWGLHPLRPSAPTTLRSRPRRASPGRLVERHRADVQLLDLIDGADGEGAVVGQRQAGKRVWV